MIMITRKLGKLLRGKATPGQLMMTCILGATIGFMPGFVQAPGLIVLLICLIALLQVNFFLAAIVGLIAKAISIPLLPLTFLIGRALLDGPTQGLFAWLINAPVTALFGFEYYITTGGLIIGPIFGIVCGLLVIRGIRAFRTKMANMQEGSERYKTWTSKWYVKAFSFVFIGGGRKEYKKLLAQKRMGNPIRPVGALLAALLVVFLFLAQQFFSEPIVTAAVQRGLERANGATVDVRSAELNLRDGRLNIDGFAMADANDLQRDLLRAERIEADVSATDLLRKRLALDQVTLIDASTGEERRVPGRIIGRPPQPVPDDPDITKPDEKTIEDYIEQAQVWKERLAQIRQWLERMSGPEDEAEPDPQKRKETLKKRLERRIREDGYAWVRATHLVRDAPTFMVYRLDAEKMKTDRLEDATVDLRGRNLSTHPHLADQPPSIRIESSDDRLLAAIALNHVVLPEQTSTLEFRFLGLDADAFADQLAFAGQKPFAGGTIDVEASGTYGVEGLAWIDLPLRATLKNSTITLGGTSRDIRELTVPIGVRGPLDQPRIMLDDEHLAQALIDAGATELLGELEGRLDEDVREKLDDNLPSGLRDQLPW